MDPIYISLFHGLNNLLDQTKEAPLACSLLGFPAIGGWPVPFIMVSDGPST